MSRGLTRSRNQRVKWLYEQKPIKLSYHPAKFLGYRHSGSRDIIFLICHVILTLWGYLENAEFTALILNILILLTSGILIYNSELPNTTGRKTKRRRGRTTQFAQTQIRWKIFSKINLGNYKQRKSPYIITQSF